MAGKLGAMNPFTRLISWLRPAPKTPEEIEATQEAEQIREEMKSVRASARSLAGMPYQPDRSSKH